MSCSCDYCVAQCDSFPVPCSDSYYSNCCPPNRSIQVPIDPIFPANEGFFKKPSKNARPIKKSLAHSKGVGKKKKSKSTLKSKSLESCRQANNCESKNFSKSEDCCEINQFEAQGSICSNISNMPPAEKCLSNFMYDNQNLKETKFKKSSSCNEILDCLGTNFETWILQCPKGFDPKTIVNIELGKLSKKNKIECCANRFSDCVSLACITPEKTAEYESVCDNVRILRPVGKIVITETKSQMTPKQSKSSLKATNSFSENEIEECSDDGDIKPSVSSKKIQKTINDQRFTIETTFTVENCAIGSSDRKKNRKAKGSQDSFEECTPICASESSPTKKKKKNKCKDSLGWMD